MTCNCGEEVARPYAVMPSVLSEATAMPREYADESCVLPPPHLTEQQLEAILYRGSPLLIIAGPGSGKTEVIRVHL